MAFRLALEAPSRFRAVAAVSASVPTPENFKCKPAGQGTSSVMIMNGTRDPINPFDGGEVKFLGLLKRGKVRSSRESGQYLAGPQQHHRHARNERDPSDRRISRRARTLATILRLKWNSLPFIAAGMAFLSHTGGIRDS